MGKISSYLAKTGLALTDYVLGNDSNGPKTKRFTFQEVLTLIQNNLTPLQGTVPNVLTGVLWTADAAGSTRAASMTSGRLRVNGAYLNISAITGRVFTASKDTYIDILDNLDGTYTVVYTEVANGATTGFTLAANSIRVGMIVTGASNIASSFMVQTSGFDYLNNKIRYTGPVGGSTAPGVGLELIGKTTLKTASDTITAANLPACKYLEIYWLGIPSGNIRGCLTFNNDSSSTYASRLSINGGSDISDSGARVAVEQTTATIRRTVYSVINIAAQEKLMNFVTSDNAGSGTGAIPGRIEGSAKWTNTTQQITRVDITNDQSGDFAAGTEILVYGRN